jgi:gluconokinase
VIFGRMLDKIRLNARDALPPEYQPNLGEVRQPLFDARCCRFLGVAYEELRARVLQGGCDEEILAWAHAGGAARNDEECMVWNRFMSKIGWRDDRSDLLRERVVEFGLAHENVETFCELLDLDEGRPLGGTRSWESPPISVVIVMGVSGCGKTTVGKGLAESLWWEFIEADDLHSAENVAKMASGVPLTDADRAPWLAAVRATIEACNGRGSRAVVACSALKEAYRLVIAPDPSCARFVHLRGEYALIKGRLGGRGGHFMKESLLRSQFETLEEPAYALTLDAADSAEAIIDRIKDVLGIP